jgi:Tfp pilus assembly protein PilF
MHERRKRVAAITLAGLIAVGALAGCTSSSTTTKGASSTTALTTATGKTIVTGLKPPASGTTNTTKPIKPPKNSATTVITHSITEGGKTQTEYEKQIVDLTAKLKSSPKDLAMLQDLAVAQYQTGKFQDAAKTYEAMLAIQDTAVVHNNYGNVLRDMGKSAEAAQQYQKALALDPSLMVATVNLIALQWRTNHAEALTTLDAAIAKATGADRTRLQAIKDKLTKSTTTT